MSDLNEGTNTPHGWKAMATTRGMGARLYKMVASDLHPGDMNTRQWESSLNRGKVVWFALSIFENTIFDGDKVVKSGILESVDAFYDETTDQYLLDAGETRWRGVRLLEGFDCLTGLPVEPGKGVLTGVDAVIPRVLPDQISFEVRRVDAKMSKTDRRFNVCLSNHASDFTDLEYAEQIAQFIKEGVPQHDIARRLGREPTWVSHINKLNNVPEALLPMLSEGQIKTTTVIEVMEDSSPDEAVALILGAIEEGRGQASQDYLAAVEDLRAGQVEVTRLLSSGEADLPANPNATSGRRLSRLDVAQRAVASASNRAETAERQMQRGPDRITNRSLQERKAGKGKKGNTAASETSTAPASETDTTPAAVEANRTNIDALLDAVRFAGRKSRESFVREAMNEALKRVGAAPVEPVVDDEGNELPLPSETVETETVTIEAADVETIAIVEDEQPESQPEPEMESESVEGETDQPEAAD